MNPRRPNICFNCNEPGHISLNCPKPWKNFRCLNCGKAGEHAAACSTKWFDLRAPFWMCSTVEESKRFNRIEYDRQRLEREMARMREYRPPTAVPAISASAATNQSVRNNQPAGTEGQQHVRPFTTPSPPSVMIRSHRLRQAQATTVPSPAVQPMHNAPDIPKEQRHFITWAELRTPIVPRVGIYRAPPMPENTVEELPTTQTELMLSEKQDNRCVDVVRFGRTYNAEANWVVRYECPSTKPVTLIGETNTIGEIDIDYQELTNNVRVRRNNGFLEFTGKPSADISVVLNYSEQLIRLRMCDTYIIVAERLRMDDIDGSNIMLNIEELSKTPPWEIVFKDEPFKPTRIRFNQTRAILSLVGGELILTRLERIP